MPNANNPSLGPPRRILVVDDERMVRDSLKMLLSFDGHHVETADNAKAALEKVSAEKFDVVLTDFEMPGMKGDQLAAAIKARSPEQAIIMISAYGQIFKAEDKQLPGVDLVLSKPLLLDTLRQALVTVLDTNKSEAAPLTPPPSAKDLPRKRPEAK